MSTHSWFYLQKQRCVIRQIKNLKKDPLTQASHLVLRKRSYWTCTHPQYLRPIWRDSGRGLTAHRRIPSSGDDGWHYLNSAYKVKIFPFIIFSLSLLEQHVGNHNHPADASTNHIRRRAWARTAFCVWRVSLVIRGSLSSRHSLRRSRGGRRLLEDRHYGGSDRLAWSLPRYRQGARPSLICC